MKDAGIPRGSKRTARPSKGSWLVSTAMVAVAGAVAWHSLGANAGQGPVAGPGTTATMAAAQAARSEAAGNLRLAGRLPTRLVVPSAGIDTAVTEVGITFRAGRPEWETAWRSAGHHLDSARPGQPGNMVLTGHVSVADRGNVPVFRDLAAVKEGDIVEVHDGETVYRYTVRDVRVVPPSAVHVLRSDHRALITLISCTPDLEERLVVTGELMRG